MYHFIFKDHHSCTKANPFPFHYNQTSVTRKVLFGNNCWFPQRNIDDLDTNKVFGLSYGNHSKNSVRFGWIPDFSKRGYIKIFSYIHNNSGTFIEYLTTVEVEEANIFSMQISDDSVLMSISNEKSGLDSTHKIAFKKPTTLFGYHLFPYFGGNNTAPQGMFIELNKI